MTEAARPALKVSILAFDGCMTAAVAGVLDALEVANGWMRNGAAASVALLSARVVAAARGPVRGSSGFSIEAAPLDAAPSGVVIVPPIVGSVSQALEANAASIAWLRQPHDAVVASVCTGTFFLAEAGLLNGRRATTNPVYAAKFSRRYRDVRLLPEERLIDEGNVLCAGSTTAFLDLSIHLLERFVSHEVAVLTAKTMCMDVTHRSQMPFFMYVAPKDHGDAAVLSLQSWMEQHFAQPLSVPELARQGAMSERNLHRRFRTATGLTPVAYMHRLRIEAAKRLLETSPLSIEEITARVGYEDTRSFSRLFRSLVSLSPGGYRRRFGATSPRPLPSAPAATAE